MTATQNGSFLGCAIVFLGITMTGVAGPKTVSEKWFAVASVLTHDDAFAGAHDVEMEGNLAFVPGKGGSIAIVDVSDPAKSKLLWFKRDGKDLQDSETVLPVGKHLLLGTRDFFSMEVSDPSKPVFLKRVADRSRIDRINGMVKRGDHVFAANKNGWIDVFDVGDIKAPALLGAYETREKHGLLSPHDVDAFGDCIAIVSPNGFGTKLVGHFAVFKVMDAAGQVLPVDKWALQSIVEDKRLIGANRVQVSGAFAYTGGSWSPGPREKQGPGTFSELAVIALADPKRPRIVASVPFSDARGPNGLTVAGRMVFIAGGQSVDAIDISDPHHPVKLGAQTFPRIKDADRTDNAHDLIYRNGYLYVSCQTDDAFLILRVTDKRILELANLAEETPAKKKASRPKEDFPMQTSALRLAREANEGSQESYDLLRKYHLKACAGDECSAYRMMISALGKNARNGCPHSQAVWRRLQKEAGGDASEKPAPDPATASGKAESLFDGKTLAGWTVKCHASDKDKKYWKVVDGTITGETEPGASRKNIWLVTEKQYDDFELSLKVQTVSTSTGNSGIQLRCRYDAEADKLDGPQVDIDAPNPWRCGLVYDSTRGVQAWVCPAIAKGEKLTPEHAAKGWTWKHADKGDAWNDMRIICKGLRIKTIVNGVTTADYDGTGRLDDEVHRLRNVGVKGHIAFQIHAGRTDLLVRFKDIRIAPLK